MPYEIKKSDTCPADKPWGLFKVGTGEKIACHPTEEAAKQQAAAIMAGEHKRSSLILPWEWRTHYEVMELREGDNGPMAVGYAFRYGKRSQDLGGFVEEIMPGAASKTIKEQDIRGLFNHDPNNLIGRMGAHTLRMQDSAEGMMYFDDLPDTSIGRDLAVLLKRGDVFGSSFSFKIVGRLGQTITRTEQGYPLRQVNEMMMRDVGPVTFPAYSSSDVTLRSITGALGAGQGTDMESILQVMQERNIPFEEIIAAAADQRLAELLKPEENRPRETHRILRRY